MAELLQADYDDESMDWVMASSNLVEKVADNSTPEPLTPDEKAELERFLAVLKSEFKRRPEINNGQAVGVIQSAEQFQSLIRKLKALGYFFSVRTSRQTTQKTIFFPTNQWPNVHFPYIVEKVVQYYCNTKTAQDAESKSCKAVIQMRQVLVLTKTTIPNTIKSKRKAVQKYNEQIANGTIQGETQIWVKISLPQAHNHPISTKGHSIDADVKAAMFSILASGVRKAEDIQQRLYEIVNADFADGPVKPTTENSSFYPNLKVICNHLRHEGLEYKPYERRKKARVVEDLRSDIISRLLKLQENVKNSSNEKALRNIVDLLTQADTVLSS